MRQYVLAGLLAAGICYACQQHTGSSQDGTLQTSVETVAEANTPAAAQTKLPIEKIKLPAGFTLSVFSDQVEGARSMAMGARGTFFVGTKGDKVYALVDENKDGHADKVYTIASGLHSPNGVAFRHGSLYVAEISRVIRYDDIEAHLQNPPKPVVVNDRFPTDEWHGWKYIAFGPDGKLYIPVGAPCNICEVDSMHGNLMRMNPDGSRLEVYAKGIRNTVGFDWQPQDHSLWFTDNGRDMLGDDIPSDELNHAPRKGMNFGFPYCHEGDIQDPKYNQYPCSRFTPPVQKLGPHVAALGMKFYTGKMFPSDYRNAIFISQHGSWNRTAKIGYRVMAVKMNGSKVASYSVFAEGWLQGGDVWGRPVDVLVMPDGSLLISDDLAGAVYRVVYKG